VLERKIIGFKVLGTFNRPLLLNTVSSPKKQEETGRCLECFLGEGGEGHVPSLSRCIYYFPFTVKSQQKGFAVLKQIG